MTKNTNTGFNAGLSENKKQCFLALCFFLASGTLLAEDAKDEAIALHRGTNPYANVGGSASQTPGLSSAAAIGVDSGGTGLATLTAFSVLIGEGTAPVHFATPGNTGIPLVSTGAASDPAFGTALVLGGGTGNTSFSALNSIILSGTTTTSAMQQVTGGTAGTILTSAGAATAPTFQSLSANVQVFTTAGAGTYTPTSGMKYVVVEAVGGGGGSGGGAATTLFASAGGGSGSYSRKVLTAGQIGAAIAYTVGAAGAAGASGGGAGGTGGNTTLGATLVTTNGGVGSATASAASLAGGAGGALGTGGVFAGLAGGATVANAGTYPGNGSASGAGADAPAGFGQGGYPVAMNMTGARPGISATGFGSGAGGGTAGNTTPAVFLGGTGAPGAIIVTEYILA